MWLNNYVTCINDLIVMWFNNYVTCINDLSLQENSTFQEIRDQDKPWFPNNNEMRITCQT